MDLKKWINKPVYIRTRAGFSKFGVVTFANEGYLLLAYFSGKTVTILADDILSIEPYRGENYG